MKGYELMHQNLNGSSSFLPVGQAKMDNGDKVCDRRVFHQHFFDKGNVWFT